MALYNDCVSRMCGWSENFKESCHAIPPMQHRPPRVQPQQHGHAELSKDRVGFRLFVVPYANFFLTLTSTAEATYFFIC